MIAESFEKKIYELLERLGSTTLPRRWDEAVSFGAGREADAFWIRESEDVVNIVWLNADGIRDITLLPQGGESMFNFVQLSTIVSFEVREGEDVSGVFGIGVKGSYIVHVIIGERTGNLYWIGETESENDDLRIFLSHVLGAFISSKKNPT
jgi:hypothetical protein